VWAALGISPNMVHSSIRHSRASTVGFASATLQLICLAVGVNKYLAVVPCQIVCKMQVAEQLLTLSLPKAKWTNFFIAGQVQN